MRFFHTLFIDPVGYGPGKRLSFEEYHAIPDGWEIEHVLEFYPSKRTIVRFDGGDTIVRYGPHFEPNPINFNVLDKLPSRVKHNLRITAGVGFRLGMAHTNQPATSSDMSDLRRYEVGIHFTSMSMNPPTPRCPDICFLSQV